MVMDPKLIAYYRGSVRRRIPVLQAARQRLGKESGAKDAEEEIRRIAHSLRGTGLSYGFPEVTNYALEVEEAPPGSDFSRSLGRLLAVLQSVAEPGEER
jgi:chemotaxis protein histidine kinase CheA